MRDACMNQLGYTPYRTEESRARNYALYRDFPDSSYEVATVDVRGTGKNQRRIDLEVVAGFEESTSRDADSLSNYR
jgi:hypothetical protein